MLKINLIPSARRDIPSAPGAGDNRIFAAAFVVVLVVLVTGLFLFHSSQQQQLARVRQQNRDVEAQVQQIRDRIHDHPRVLSDLAEIRAREEAIGHLETARTGPTSMLVELSHLLSPGGRPSSDPAVLDRVQRDAPTQLFNPTWDSHRLWLRAFTERDRAVVIEGAGRTADDVGEFMRRMMLSQYFEQVRLERSEGGIDEGTHIQVQRFRVAARVRY